MVVAAVEDVEAVAAVEAVEAVEAVAAAVEETEDEEGAGLLRRCCSTMSPIVITPLIDSTVH